MTPQMGVVTDADLAAAIAAHAVLTTGIHGVGAGAIVGTTLSQTLTNKTLTSPAINGTVTTTGLTMPAFTAGGDINIGANFLRTTNLLIGEKDSSTMMVRNAANTAYLNLQINALTIGTVTGTADTNPTIAARNIADNYMIFQARDTGAAALQEAMRIGGGAIVFMSMPADTQVGFFGAPPVSKAAHIDNSAGDDATAVNAILVVLENLGLVAAS